MSTEAEKRASLKYEKENVRQISVKLNKKTDADILKALDQIRTSGGSIQGFIKKAIRASLQYNGNVTVSQKMCHEFD